MSTTSNQRRPRPATDGYVSPSGSSLHRYFLSATKTQPFLVW
jgi:hypothetical protein